MKLTSYSYDVASAFITWVKMPDVPLCEEAESIPPEEQRK